MNRILFFILCITPFLHLESTLADKMEKPNVILIMCDDLGWGDVGFNGNKIIKTPNLDLMAKNGLRFQRFYSASAVCSPTRGSVLTGRNPMRLGIPTANAGHLKESETTLAEHLKGIDYQTGHFGKWHLGTFTQTQRDSNRGGQEKHRSHFTQPDDHGYDTYFATEAKVPTFDPMVKPKNHPARTWWDPVTEKEKQVPYNTAYWDPDGVVSNNLQGDNSRVIMNRVIPFIDSAHKANEPFFASIWFHTPHLPVVAGPEMTKLYSQYSKYEQHYFGCITAMDHQVGRLRDYLRNNQIHNNTMIWFCSDNGPEGKKGSAPGSTGHLRGRKRDLLEGGIRVPALLEWPARIEPGKSTSLPCFTSDYLPTILEWTGVKYNSTKRPLDGISLCAQIETGDHVRPAPMAFHFGGQQALIQNRFKLHVRKKGNNPGSVSSALYDITNDPGESNDLSSKFPFLTAQMLEQLTIWSKECLSESQRLSE